MDYCKEMEMLKKASNNMFVHIRNNYGLKNVCSHLDRTNATIKQSPKDVVNDIKSLEEKVAVNTIEITRAEAEAKSLLLQNKDMTQELDSCQHQCEQQDSLLLDLRSDVETLRQKISKKLKFTAEEIKLNQEEADFYQERLGFRMKTINSGACTHIEFQFTNIDSRNPERIFSISVKMNEQRTISVTDCQPHVSGLSKLVKKLNETNDWHSFFVVLRQQFADLAIDHP